MDITSSFPLEQLHKNGFAAQKQGQIIHCRLTPHFGDGTIKMYVSHKMFAVMKINCTLLRDTSYVWDIPPCYFAIIDFRHANSMRCHELIQKPAQTTHRAGRHQSLAIVLHYDFCATTLVRQSPEQRRSLRNAAKSINESAASVELKALLLQIAKEPLSAHSDLYFEAKIKEILHTLIKGQKMSSPKTPSLEDMRAVLAVEQYLKQNYAAPLSTSDCCKIAAMSKTKLCDAFRQMKGMTMSQLLQKNRIDRAKTLLAETDMSIAEIASAIGYANHSSFSTRFRAMVGESPSAFRARN